MSQALSLVIPTFNEAANVPRLLERLARALAAVPQDYELLVVDDDSPDGTWRVAEALRERYPQVRVLRRQADRGGLARAVVDGWEAAHGELLAVMDADLQHPPEVLRSLVGALEDETVDIAIASRYLDGAGSWRGPRRWGSRAASRMAYLVLPAGARGVTDPLSGYFVLRRGVIHDAPLKPRGYKILLDVLARGRYRRIVEIPYPFGTRVHGRSKVNAVVILDYLRQLWDLSRAT